MLNGSIFLANKLAAPNLRLKLYKTGFASDTEIATTTTDANGKYSFDLNNEEPGLSFTIYAEDHAGKEVPLMKSAYTSGEQAEINLVAPAGITSTDPEYTRLMGSLTPILQNKRLAEARENEARQDLSFLFQQTGWDSRLVGLAALADKRSTDTGLPAELLYALFRTGLPTGPDQLARVSPTGIERAVKKANEAGIAQIKPEEAKRIFTAFAEKTLREGKTAGGIASVNDFLKKIQLSAEEENSLSHIYFNENWTGQEIWDKAKEAGVSNTSIKKLQLQGKLSFLTVNNPELSNKLQTEISAPEKMATLAEKGYYKADLWKKTIKELAGNDAEKLSALIPANYDGKKVGDRLEAYAEDMSRKIRTAYPTQSLSAMIREGDLVLGKQHHEVKDVVSKLLSNAAANLGQGASYSPGGVSLNAFAAKHKEALLKGIPAAQADQALDSLKTFTKLYQISPTDEAMQVLYDLGFNSALDISTIPYKDWLIYYGPKFKTQKEAILVYEKSEQCKTMVYNFYTAAEQLNNATTLPVTSSATTENETIKNEMIKNFPSLETLFGSMDFCECDHCRSVLSPAAYLVDILKFLDPDDASWDRTKLLWQQKHGGTAYTGKKPFEVLKSRRADISSIALNCENTNTVLPYIDIVNEILEGYVANQDMATMAYDSSEYSAQELIAEPQNILPAAYDHLNKAIFPLQLPFDYPLELSRKLSDYFGIPFWKLLQHFKKTDGLFAGAAVTPSYLNDIFMEYLGLSSKEYQLLSKPNFSQWFLLYGYPNEAEALTKAVDADTKNRLDLLSAKTLSRKLGITYKELAEIIKTSFINPLLNELVILRTLKISASDVFRWKSAPGYTPSTPAEKADFEAGLSAASTADFDATAWLNKFWSENLFARIILLHDTDSSGNFDETTLQFANGSALTSLDWVKLNIFVRLWRKLGWKIEEVDYVLSSFIPKDTTVSAASFEEKIKTALIYIAHVKQLHDQFPLGKSSIQKWTSVWGRLDGGRTSSYSHYFLSTAIKKDDPIYSHPLGKYLSAESGGTFVSFDYNPALPENRITGNVGLIGHLFSVQAALGLSQEEISAILRKHGQDLSTAALSMNTLSLLHGYIVLREATKLSVANLITLQDLSGLDPLKPLHSGPLTTLAEDYPYTKMLAFLELAAEVKEAGFSISEMDYMVRHNFDPVGPYAINERDTVDFIRSLSMEMNRVQLEQSPPQDASGFSDDYIQERLVLALSPEVAKTFIDMWNDVRVVSASRFVVPAKQFPAHLFSDNKKLSLSYDAVRQTQSMAFTGILDDVQLAGLVAELSELALLPPTDSHHISAEQQSLAEELLDMIQQQSKMFYEQHIFKPILKEEAAFNFSSFFPLVDTALSERQQLEMKNKKRTAIGSGTLKYLEAKLLDAAVITAVAETFQLEQSMAKFLLTNPNILDLGGSSLQETYLKSNEQGLSIHFIKDEANGEFSGPPIQKRSAHIAAADVPSNTSVILVEGYLESQVSEAHRFYVQGSKAGTNIKLSFQHQKNPLISATLASDQEEVSEFIPLEAGIAYKFSLEIRNLNGGSLVLGVQTEAIPRTELNVLKLIPSALVEAVQEAHLLLGKVERVISQFSLGEKEIRYLGGNPTHFYQLAFKDLPVKRLNTKVGTEKQQIEKLLRQLLSLSKYYNHKKEMVGGDLSLIDMLESIGDDLSATLDKFVEEFALHTRRDLDVTRKVVDYFGFKPSSFTESTGLKTLWEALKIVHSLGVSVASVTAVTGVVSKSASFAQRYAAATHFKNSLKSKYSRENWLQVAQSVYDKLRPQQRDALSAFIMHKEKFSRLGQLFEFFLLDPGMEPVVQTSRIRLAISSVQTFVQRCSLNLEPGVSPSIINRKHWEWMKRYRVWEANRKIFLFPENWLEPEFRDDKTHLFKELEGAVMQGDINKELVEKAFFQYLKGLEKISRLNMVAMYCEEDLLTLSNNTIHVIGKAYAQPNYYYRTYRNNMWAPWVPIPDQIEGEHLALIKWQDRLHVFWLTFLQKSESLLEDSVSMEAAAKKSSVQLVKHSVEIQLNWCEYAEGEWRSRETGGFENALVSDVPANFNPANVYVHASIEHNNDGEESAVRIHVNGEKISSAFRMVSKLAHPTSKSAYYKAPSDPAYDFNKKEKTKYRGSDKFKVTYDKKITTTETTENGKKKVVTSPVSVEKTLLQHTTNTSFLFCNDVIEVSGDAKIDSLISPFFFEDHEKSVTLFVEPEVREKTVVTWEEWIIKEEVVIPVYDNDDFWKKIPVKEIVPFDKIREFDKLIDPKVNPYINPYEEVINPGRDWVTNPGTVIQYEDSFLGSKGGLILEKAGNGQFGSVMTGINTGAIVNVNPGSDLVSGPVIIKEQAPSTDGSKIDGLSSLTNEKLTSINIIGSKGMTGNSLANIAASNQKSLSITRGRF